MAKEYEYGYPAVIWSDGDDDNFVLNENYELIIRFDDFGGTLQLYSCISDEMAIEKAKEIEKSLKRTD